MGVVRRLMAALTGSEYVPDGLQDFLDECANMDGGTRSGNRCSDYTLYEQYYDGEHGPKLRDRAKEYLQLNGIRFCENFCEPIVDALAERLSVIGFSSSLAAQGVDDKGAEITVDPVAQQVEKWWSDCRMDGVQPVVHTQSLIKADEFVIVEWDPDKGRPRILRQQAHQVRVFYSDEAPDTVEYASKLWNTSAESAFSNPNGKRVQRLNLYFPGRVEKWFRAHTGSGSQGKGGWERWQDDGDTGWPVWLTMDGTETGEPVGVIVVHFRNKPLGSGYGRSRVRPAIPFQTELNKYLTDLNDLVDNHGLPQDYATGVSGDTTLERVPGDVWTAADAAAQFGRLAASDTANIINAIEGVLSRLARRSRVPMHVLTGGTPPSGEALKTSESGLVATAQACQVVFGNAWEDAMGLAVRLGLAFGDDATKAALAPAADGVTLSAQWANPETRSDADDLAVAQGKQRLGVSKHTLLSELGYDPEKERELRDAETASAAEAAGSVFDRGRIPA